jgi:hypothetical protein
MKERGENSDSDQHRFTARKGSKHQVQLAGGQKDCGGGSSY